MRSIRSGNVAFIKILWASWVISTWPRRSDYNILWLLSVVCPLLNAMWDCFFLCYKISLKSRIVFSVFRLKNIKYTKCQNGKTTASCRCPTDGMWPRISTAKSITSITSIRKQLGLTPETGWFTIIERHSMEDSCLCSCVKASYTLQGCSLGGYSDIQIALSQIVIPWPLSSLGYPRITLHLCVHLFVCVCVSFVCIYMRIMNWLPLKPWLLRLRRWERRRLRLYETFLSHFLMFYIY